MPPAKGKMYVVEFSDGRDLVAMGTDRNWMPVWEKTRTATEKRAGSIKPLDVVPFPAVLKWIFITGAGDMEELTEAQIKKRFGKFKYDDHPWTARSPKRRRARRASASAS